MVGVISMLIILAIPAYGYVSTFVLPPRQWVVQVNDESHNMGYLLKLLRMFQQGSQLGAPGVNLGTLPFELVNTLAENELIRQGAPSYEINVTRVEVDAEVRDRFLNNPSDAETPPDQLEREFEERYRQYLNLIQISEDDHRVIVTSELYRQELRDYLGREVDRVQPQIHLFSIVIPSVENAAELVDEVQTEYARGTPFEELVARPDMNQSAEAVRKGGEVNWVPRGIYPDLDPFLFDELEVGALSEPIPDFNPGAGGNTFTIYLVKEKADAREVEDRHLDTLKTRALEGWLQQERQVNVVRINFGSERYEWLLDQLRLSSARS